MDKKGISFSIGRNGIIWLIISWLIAYLIYQYAKTNDSGLLAFLAKEYLVITIGFIGIILGIILLIILFFLILLLIIRLFGKSMLKRFYRVKNNDSNKKRKKHDSKDVIDAEYKIKE